MRRRRGQAQGAGIAGPMLGGLLALAATLLWAGNFVAARAAAQTIDPVALSFLRWALATTILMPFVVGEMRRARWQLWAHGHWILVSAFFGITAFNTSVYTAGRYLDATHMSLVNAAAPILILLLSLLFLGERIDRRGAAGMAMAAAGIGLSALDGAALESRADMLLGLGWMTLAASCFAIYTVLSRRLVGHLPFMALIGSTFLVGTLLLLPGFIARVEMAGWPQWSARNLLLIGYAGLAASLVAFVCWNRAVALVGAAQAGYVYYLVPLLSASLSWWLLGEVPGPWTVVAAPLVIAGIVLAVRPGRKPVAAGPSRAEP